MSDKKIHKGEQAIIDMGMYVALPINMNILLTQNERDVLNVIRHCNNNGENIVETSSSTLSVPYPNISTAGSLQEGQIVGRGYDAPQ